MSAEWLDRSQFHEVAEAIKISTDQVISVAPALLVTYSAGFSPDDRVFAATLSRNPADGVFAVLTRRVLCTVGEWERDMRQSLDELLGEPLEDDDDA
ncbi:MAG TPA: hypothetical protein VH541_05775 [Gaiellaceae bacterium]|jgi:hypothetical protein